MTNNIKWACIQPLTGGMYIGAELAIGKPAEFILSYEGLDEVTYDKEGNIKNASNEYNLVSYLKKHNRMPKYYKIKRSMFNTDINDLNPDIVLDGEQSVPNYTDLDIVVAVPVCSGLSMVTAAKDDTKNARNCNMLWLANYTLNVIKPKVYCFENAPTLMGSRGIELRKTFEDMATNSGYSLLYYKTDTHCHNNPQQRPRTFVVFIKHNSNNEIENPPVFEFQNIEISPADFFATISKDAEQMTPVDTSSHNLIVIDFIKHKLGKEWTSVIDGALMTYIIRNKLFNELIEFTNNSNYDEKIKEKAIKYFNHIDYKLSIGKNYYGDDICLCKTKFPSVQFRMIPNMLHPLGHRMCTVREYLSLMGMPEDFILYGDKSNLPKIGQNVPVHTAEFIVHNIMNIINNWNEKRINECNVVFQNNINQTINNI